MAGFEFARNRIKHALLNRKTKSLARSGGRAVLGLAVRAQSD